MQDYTREYEGGDEERVPESMIQPGYDAEAGQHDCMQAGKPVRGHEYAEIQPPVGEAVERQLQALGCDPEQEHELPGRHVVPVPVQ